MPIAPHRRKLGPNWNEGARLLWLAMLENDIKQSEVRKKLRGASGNELADGAVNRWLYGDRRPTGDLPHQIEDQFGVPARAWRQPALGGLPSRRRPAAKVAA